MVRRSRKDLKLQQWLMNNNYRDWSVSFVENTASYIDMIIAIAWYYIKQMHSSSTKKSWWVIGEEYNAISYLGFKVTISFLIVFVWQ